MKRFGKRALALWLAILMLALCACSAKSTQTSAAAEEKAAQETVSETKAEEAETEKTEEQSTAQEDVQEKPVEEETAVTEEQPEEAAAQTQTPAEEQTPEQTEEVPEGPLTCTISISCATILEHLDELDPEKVELVPEDGWILSPVTVEFTEGQNVFDVLLAAVKANAIHMEYQNTPVYETAYIEGIGNLYEFDCGALSGWMYRVNGWFPNYGCSRYAVQTGDVIEWVYTCDLGSDVGGSGVSQADE